MYHYGPHCPCEMAGMGLPSCPIHGTQFPFCDVIEYDDGFYDLQGELDYERQFNMDQACQFEVAYDHAHARRHAAEHRVYELEEAMNNIRLTHERQRRQHEQRLQSQLSRFRERVYEDLRPFRERFAAEGEAPLPVGPQLGRSSTQLAAPDPWGGLRQPEGFVDRERRPYPDPSGYGPAGGAAPARGSASGLGGSAFQRAAPTERHGSAQRGGFMERERRPYPESAELDASNESSHSGATTSHDHPTRRGGETQRDGPLPDGGRAHPHGQVPRRQTTQRGHRTQPHGQTQDIIPPKYTAYRPSTNPNTHESEYVPYRPPPNPNLAPSRPQTELGRRRYHIELVNREISRLTQLDPNHRELPGLWEEKNRLSGELTEFIHASAARKRGEV